jgi:spore maturation protein CgeB
MSRVLLNFRSGFAGLREGFEALGHEVLENEWAPEDAALEGAVLCVADFVDCARRLRRLRGLRQRLTTAGVPLVALSRDAPWHRGVHRARLAALGWFAPFDLYAAHSMQSAGRFARRTAYCPNAAREAAYGVTPEELRAMRDPASYRWEVSFVGNLDTRRYPEHARRAAFLSGLSDKLNDLRIKFVDSTELGVAEQIEITKRSRINLSTFAACDAGAEASWGLPERCYGVPACGGFLLSDRRRHAAQDFAADEWADYNGLEECAARIRHFLARFDEARGIAERAQGRVTRDHGYRKRAELLLDSARHAR